MEFGNTLMLLPHRLLLCYLVLLSSQGNILCSEVVGPSKVKSSLLDTTTWVLIPKEAEVIHSLANLTDGVYSLKPATVRPTCLTAEGSGLGAYLYLQYKVLRIDMNTWGLLLCRFLGV